MSSNYFPGVKIQLFGPSEVKIMTPSSYLGGISRGSKKSRLFRIKALKEGIFSLTADLIYKKGQLASLPVEIRAGSNWMQYQQKKTPEVSSPEEARDISKEDIPLEMISCPFCGMETDGNSKFCSSCGAEIEIKVKTPKQEQSERYCPDCGEKMPPEAKFCRMCGKGRPE